MSKKTVKLMNSNRHFVNDKKAIAVLLQPAEPHAL